jgi:fumarate reductase flavoprotein subunit
MDSVARPPAPADLIVVGGGIAGLTAALRAAELGLAVRVLEQGADERYACNTRFSGGLLHAAFLDPNRPSGELRELLRRATRGLADPALIDTVAVDARRLLAFLRSHRVLFMRVSTLEAHRWGLAPPRPVAPKLDWRGRGPDLMLRTLRDALRARGGDVVLGARVQALALAAGAITGVRGTLGGAAHSWQTRAVGIADGGFQANPDLFRRYIGPAPERMLQRGAATGRGDGLAMAMAAGAATTGLNKFYGHLQIRAALDDPRLWPYPELDALGAASIVVGPDGARIADEGLGGISLANALARLPDPASATLVCNAAIWNGPGKTGRIPANPTLERFGGKVIRADTIAALAGQCGIDPDGLAATVRAHNAALSQGTLDRLDPPRSTGRFAAWPIDAPYLALPLCAGITFTTGGIVVDSDGAVLRDDGSAIRGLYAAGSCIGGVDGCSDGDGDARVDYIGGLVKAVFGLRAAEHAARSRVPGREPLSAEPASP